MEKIAFISGETIYYWSSIVLTLATLTAICFFWSLYLGRGGNGIAAFSVIPLAIVLSLLLGRLVHWYCRTSSYDSFEAAMKPFSPGGYALLGVFAGCVLAAVVIRLLHFDRNLPQMLDCMAVAGCAGIAVGRLACFFNSTDRGQIITSTQSLPWVYPVTNAVSGATEYRLATFILQAMAALVLFLILLSFYLPKKQRKDGDTALIFLLLYGVSQIVLDSTRYDKLFFRSNGFVSVVQVLGALGLLLVIVVFSARMVKARGFRFWNVLVWLGIAACIGGAGFMEYYVQRHGDLAAFSYSIMSACLLAAAAACRCPAAGRNGRCGVIANAAVRCCCCTAPAPPSITGHGGGSWSACAGSARRTRMAANRAGTRSGRMRCGGAGRVTRWRRN